MKNTIAQTLALLSHEKRTRWLLLVVLGLGASVIEIAGAVALFVLISLISDPTGEVEIPVVGNPRSLFPGVSDDSFLLGAIVAMGVFFLVRGVIQIVTVYTQSRVAENLGARISNRLVLGYLRSPYEFHIRRNSSELIRNGQSAVQMVVGQVFLPLLTIAAEAVLALGMLVVLFATAPGATGLAIVVVGSAAALLLFVVQPRLKRTGVATHRMQAVTLRWLQQGLHGIRDIKILGKEKPFAQRYSKARLRLARANYVRATLMRLPSVILEWALVGFILVWFGLTLTTGAPADQTISVMALFAYAGFRLRPSLQRIVGGLNSIRFATAPLDALHADLALIEGLDQERGPVESLPFDRRITLQNVTFTYGDPSHPALKGIDLEVNRGDQIGICGPTGGGKTTLIDVISGLLEPTSGRVLIDDADLRGRERMWQRNLGVVPQMVFLVDDTLAGNIALGVEADQIDEAALQEAIDLAQLRDFVDSLPLGVETVVGERGVRISGGQRQRVAIARALYRRPDVLIFDEGTSALDSTTETQLMESILRLRDSHTIILVAHRLSTVRSSDRVVFVDGGQIAGIGTFSDLEKENAAFREMARSTS